MRSKKDRCKKNSTLQVQHKNLLRYHCANLHAPDGMLCKKPYTDKRIKIPKDKMARSFIILLLLLLINFLSFSENSKNALLSGTWSGSIGKYKVIACFQTECKDFYAEGRYYYLKYGTPISLKRISETCWSEPDSNIWQFEKITLKEVTGKWYNRKKNLTLNIQLTYHGTCYNDVKYSESPCRCDSDSTPVFRFPKPVIDTIKKSNACYYRTFNLDAGGITVEWFELLGGRDADKKINVALNGKYPFDRIDEDYFDQFENENDEDHSILRPVLWIGRLLVVHEAHSWYYQGLNHDQFESNYRTFDLSTGEEINMKSWRSWIEGKYMSEWGVGEELNKLIISKYINDNNDEYQNDCLSMYDQETQYKVRLDTAGIVFYADFVTGNCEEEFKVSFQELEPFFSEDGRKMMRLFLYK